MPAELPAHESIPRHIIKKSQDNKVLLHSTGNYIQHPVINHNGKKMKKNTYIYIYVYVYICVCSFIYMLLLRNSQMFCSWRSTVMWNPWSRKWQPTPCSCLENPMDRGARRATVHGVCTELDTTEVTKQPQ